MVLGGSDDFGYGISASESYPDVCVFEYVCDFAYLWGNVCECCPSLVFVRACDINLVFHSSTIAMMHGPINIRFTV